ncbi:MAG TPA: hypothetical protein VN520_23435 [Streptomyces sp.]|uniref:hypothetical protein n=1 Tax=Streptomyces sp. TaxID=1931 RepID=UPI002B65CDFB|nr:hypothetical protein [Streptomyces sp.]HWU09298.1 hypothetical protein [Streptomyces sp.]
MRRLALMLVLGSVTLAACQPPQVNPVAIRRYAAARFVRDTAQYGAITVFSLPVPGAEADGVLDLSPQAQAEFVRAVAATPTAKSPGTIAAGLASPIQPETSPPGTRNLARVSRRVVFSIENRSMNPADRLHTARIIVRLNPDSAVFTGWDRIATRHNKVDVGTLTFTQERDVGGELGLTIPVVSATPKVTSSAGSSLVENVTLSQRLVELNGALTPSEAVLLQQSTAGLDLTGNVLADFVVQMRRPHPEWFYSFTHDGDGCGQPRLRGEYNWITTDTRPVPATVVLDYVLRRVDGGAATITESDDTVTFVSAAQPIQAELIPTSALVVHSWLVRADRTLEGVLNLRSNVGGMDLERAKPVQFASYEDAERMVIWLKRCNGQIPGFEATIRGRRPDAQRLYIDRVEANTDPVDR